MSSPPSARARAVLLFATLALLGCATTPSGAQRDGSSATQVVRDPRDPFERLNRASFRFNDTLDRRLIAPIARGYQRVTPRIVRTGISNFFANARYPTVVINSALQGKVRDALQDGARFLVNTTIGIGGLADAATPLGLDARNEDFGQTLGRWGMPAGPYLVVPFFGPYTLRDGIGSLADDFTEPRHYLEDDSTRYGLWLADRLDARARLLAAGALLERTGDPYTFVRSAYLQRREFLVRDGNVEEDASLLEDFGEDEPAAATDDAPAGAEADEDAEPDAASPPQDAAGGGEQRSDATPPQPR